MPRLGHVNCSRRFSFFVTLFSKFERYFRLTVLMYLSFGKPNMFLPAFMGYVRTIGIAVSMEQFNKNDQKIVNIRFNYN